MRPLFRPLPPQAAPRPRAQAHLRPSARLSELIVALNGYTVTSGILVGISDGAGLNTVPLETDVKLCLGYVVKKGAALDIKTICPLHGHIM